MTDRKTAADLMLAQLIGKVSEEDIQMLHVEAEWNARGDGYTYRVVRAEVVL
jgi:hypothetical protein